MNAPEEKPFGLTTTSSGGLIRRMDQPLELVNRLMGEIQAKQTGLSNTKTLEVPLGGGVMMLMKWCPPGSFLMGSPEGEEERYCNENQVHVTLSKGFWIAQTQVTQAQWKAVMGNNRSSFWRQLIRKPPTSAAQKAVMANNPSYFKGENRPVETVSWHDAQEFISRINATDTLSDGMQMALLTEAQWEYACRAGEAGPYSGGTLDEVAWYHGNSGGQTHPVGEKKPNAWGLHDMHGNVWEWCSDWYGGSLQGGVDPKGLDSGSFRVLRGGSWNFNASYCRVAGRYGYSPTYSSDNIGFRVVCSSVP
jgi:formylglycine-generating enzyme required for sulfatase activity